MFKTFRPLKDNETFKKMDTKIKRRKWKYEVTVTYCLKFENVYYNITRTERVYAPTKLRAMLELEELVQFRYNLYIEHKVNKSGKTILGEEVQIAIDKGA